VLHIGFIRAAIAPEHGANTVDGETLSIAPMHECGIHDIGGEMLIASGESKE
jgi:hypothetical protein